MVDAFMTLPHDFGMTHTFQMFYAFLKVSTAPNDMFQSG